MTVLCDYCQQEAKQVGGKEVYPHRPDLYDKQFFICWPCGARVGCHPDTNVPLGRLANAELRKMKSLAHQCFDPLWKERGIPRGKAYGLLAKSMNMSRKDCHIGLFDETLCKQVIYLCNSGEIFRYL